jgi:8-oxo-dGTP pyrophosphatase MutT (NUDIX family)
MPHIHEKIDFAADVFIVNKDAVLLRMHDKYGTWFPPGGHVELDEDPAEAAVREAKEEVGLDVTLVGKKPADFEDGEREVLVPEFINRHKINDTHEHVSFVYFGTSESRDITQGETEISSNIKWFTKEELADSQYAVWPRVQNYARAALEALS